MSPLRSLIVILFPLFIPPVQAAEQPWSLRPLSHPKIPPINSGLRNPIDAFLLAKLRENGLDFSPEADRRTLIRRVTLDLTGLPPTPEAITAFLADPAPDAYERLIDSLLASPAYGERWARHWLDVAHYADTHGHDQDRPRPNAWPYRDYLIRSFNADKPYAQFVQEQIAGDALFPNDPDAIVATGFLAAGPWDESSLRDIKEDSLDREVGRYLDRDDIVTSVMSTFTSSTVGCARCHDHKFDPISQNDYYALQAIFSGVDKSDRTYDADSAIARRRASLLAERAELKASQGQNATKWLSPERQAEVAAFETAFREATHRWVILDPSEYRSANGSELKKLPDRSILSTGPRPERDTYSIAATTTIDGITGLRIEVLADDSLPHRGPGRQDNGNLHLSEVRLFVDDKPMALRNPVADFDQQDWAIPRAIDGNPSTAWGIYPAVGKSHQAVFECVEPIARPAKLRIELDQLHGQGHLIGRVRLAVTKATRPLGLDVAPLPTAIADLLVIPAAQRTDAQRAELARLARGRLIEQQLSGLPAPAKVYVASNDFAPDGSFRPSATPRPVHVLRRGDVTKPLQLAVPGVLKCVEGVPFTIANANDEADRRQALARWLTDPRHPLTWRSIVNRVWHYHFGRGIVDTPNDLGKMGSRPSHPELLDWLAGEFIAHDGSFKHLHRLILTSRAYRQSCVHHARAAALDADNRLLWRMNRGRLDAESVRDAILLASGRMDRTMYGPPAQQFLMKPGIHVTPEVDYERFDVDSPASRRRGVYRFIFRTRPDPLLETLDCPDSSQSAPVRATSISPLQALALWNDKFLTRNSEHLATLAESQSLELRDQVRFSVQQILGREPTPAESASFLDYARQHGLTNLCRVLFNFSEFLFID